MIFRQFFAILLLRKDMKVIKFLFNRAVIISLLLLLQILLLCVFINVFNTYFGYIYILLGIISGLLFYTFWIEIKNPISKCHGFLLLLPLPHLAVLSIFYLEITNQAKDIKNYIIKFIPIRENIILRQRAWAKTKRAKSTCTQSI